MIYLIADEAMTSEQFRFCAKISTSSFYNLASFIHHSHQYLQMAAITVPERVPQRPVDYDLTDEQIDALLARASARLKAKSQSQELLTLDKSEESYHIPKLQTGEIAKPYTTSTKQNVAIADAARLVDEKQRKKADGIRVVSESVASKKLAREVCQTHTSLSVNAVVCNEENHIPKLS
jgi:hypothetical protein